MAITVAGNLPVEIVVSNGGTTIRRVAECRCCPQDDSKLANVEDEPLGFNASDDSEEDSDDSDSGSESFDLEVGIGSLDGIRAILDSGT